MVQPAAVSSSVQVSVMMTIVPWQVLPLDSDWLNGVVKSYTFFPMLQLKGYFNEK